MASDDGQGGRPGVLGSYIRAERQLADLSLRQLAGLANVSNAYLSQIERGLHQPSLKVLRAIAGALNLSGETLLAEAGLLDPHLRDHGSRDADGRAAAAKVGGPVGVESAVLADPDLSAQEKQALLAVYRNFRRRHDG